MTNDPQTVFSATKFRVVEHRIAVQGQSDPVVRHTIQHPGAVAIIPLLDDGQVCLIRNNRIAINKTLVELPAGTLEPNEPPLQTAERELQEETGYRATHWHELNGFFMSPGILNERLHLFVARDLTAGKPAREADESIDNLIVPWGEAVAMVLRGEIEDAKSVAAILLWDRLSQDAL